MRFTLSIQVKSNATHYISYKLFDFIKQTISVKVKIQNEQLIEREQERFVA